MQGKEFTIADDKGPNLVLINEKEGVFISSVYSKQADRKRKIFGKATTVLQSRDGQFAILASEKQILIYSLKQQRPVAEKEFNYIYSISLSPSGTFLQVMDKISINEGKTILFSFPSFIQIAVHKEDQATGYFNKQHFPLIKFSADDSHYFRYNSKFIEVYLSKGTKKNQIQSGLIQFFEVSKISKGQEYFIVTIFLDKKTNQGKCQIFTQKSKDPIYTKNIKKAEQIKIRFSPVSNQFLMELQTYFDPTGKSYYGQFGLYLYNDEKNKIASVKTQNGPVHDFSWHANGNMFIVISGFMPASIKMIGKDNQLIYQFGKKHRNCINWGNLGRFICFAGFGNLNGQMQIWDLQQKKQIGYCKSSSASYCQWSLDDRKILTGIVTPRLRVDNCLKVFSYTGTQLNKTGYQQTQLYNVSWLKVPNFKSEPRGVTPDRKIEIEPKKEQSKFKSFSAALNFGGFSLNQKTEQKEKPKLVPGQYPDQQIHKKKRRKKNPKDVDSLGPS